MILQYFIHSFVTKLIARFIKLITSYSGLIHTHIGSTGIDNGKIFVAIAEDIVRATEARTDRSVVVEPAKTVYHL